MLKPEINVTPLIDVLLVLLIIFIVVTPMKPSAFDARIPQQQTDDLIVEPSPQTLIVTVGRDSTLRLNREPAASTVDDPKALIETLKNIFDLRTQNMAFAEESASNSSPHIERTVFIKAPRGLDYGSVARVIDAVKTGGASPVSLQIDDLD